MDYGLDAIFRRKHMLDIVWFNPDADEPMWESCSVDACDVIEALKQYRAYDPYFDSFGFKYEEEAQAFVIDYLQASVNQYCDLYEEGDDYSREYPTADFINGRDGGWKEEAMFIINWAREEA